jgi:hypothetical protein
LLSSSAYFCEFIIGVPAIRRGRRLVYALGSGVPEDRIETAAATRRRAMAVSDQFRASLPDDAGEPDAANGGDRKRKDDAAETPDVGGEESVTPPAPARRRSRKSAEDTETQLKRLEQAGFSRAEAARLIFERMRPREEGLART